LTISGDVSRAGSQLFDSANEAGDDSDTFQRLGLYVTAGRKAVQGNLYLAIARPDWSKPQIALSNAREQMSLDGVCIEGASRDEDIDHGAFGPLDAIR
jgi:hypothetical protein